MWSKCLNSEFLHVFETSSHQKVPNNGWPDIKTPENLITSPKLSMPDQSSTRLRNLEHLALLTYFRLNFFLNEVMKMHHWSFNQMYSYLRTRKRKKEDYVMPYIRDTPPPDLAHTGPCDRRRRIWIALPGICSRPITWAVIWGRSGNIYYFCVFKCLFDLFTLEYIDF